MQSFKSGERVYHKDEYSCTGLIIQTNYDWHGQTCLVRWDADETTDEWYSSSYLRIIPSQLSNYSTKKEEPQNMSQAIWCDQGGHAFSAKDPDREHYTSSRQVKEGNIVQQVTAELDICGECKQKMRFSEVPAISATVVQDKVPSE